MTNEEAINYFKRSYTNGNNDDERQHNEALDMAIKSLEQTRWIPVTERLPEEHKWVLCSCRASIYEVLMLTNKGWEDGYDKVYMQGFVVAWMPLPKEPPKAESEEKQEQTGGEANGE